MLQYLGAKKYPQIYSMAVRHTQARTEDNPSAPPLAFLTNPIVHGAFVAIIRLIEFFADMKDDKLCVEVSQALNEEQRERILFRLLEVPSDDVKDAVMACINEVKL